MDQQAYGGVAGRDEEDTEENIREENGRNEMRLERGNEELAAAGRCPQKDNQLTFSAVNPTAVQVTEPQL